MKQCGCTRRQMVRSLVAGSMLFPGILANLMAADPTPDELNPLAPKKPHFPGKAKRVIFLYMTGGVSHMDSFDYKPRLFSDGGKPVDKNNPNGSKYVRPLWEFNRHGKCGMEISELFPNIAKCADDICLIRSMRSDHIDHVQATLGLHSGSVTVTRPSIGSWVSYGLGTENQNLPSFVVLAPELPYGGTQVFASDFLPGVYQGTRVSPGAEPIPNLNRRAASEKIQQMELGLLDRFNRKHQQKHPGDSQLAARIKSFETAFGMQREMPEVLDLSKETDATLALYGLERGSTQGFAWQCLVARRMAERGVRFVELIDVGSDDNWDAHSDMQTHGPLALNVDRAIYGLIQDLKSRGMFEDTLVVWTTEFGRTPQGESAKGRGHHNGAYSMWMAGGGVKAGFVYGNTDDYGHRIVENPVHIHDFHATILHLLGFDHEKLTFRHAGRDYRLTDVSGEVIKAILA